MDVLMEYVGWRSAAVLGRYAGVTASAAMSGGTKRSCDTASIDADVLSLSEGFVESNSIPSGRSTAAEPLSPLGSVRELGTTRKRSDLHPIQTNDDIEIMGKTQQVWV